ncbi:MAG TPA: pyruvoyl-dependent arginine decarboxylase [Propionibacteriaceae bacterium]|nr:pyruvoyl-dependent arginine decarboxylase [Propionibacteriaceae bacterium]
MEEPPDRVPHARLLDAPQIGSRSGPGRLLIRVSMGSGTGPTRLAAFDAALFAAGVAGYNIIRLSSVVPPHAVVREVPGPEQVQGAPGDVAYCVYAAAYASNPGNQAWAGLAWAIDPEQSGGAGVLVEHAACSESVVRRDLDATIEAMSRIRGHRYRMTGQTVSSAVCIDHPVCAVVVATYGTAGWSDLLNSEV